VFPRWGEGGTPSIVGAFGADARALLAASPYGPVYDLARRLRAQASTPFAYVRAIERHLRRNFVYTESPRRSRVPLADFLLRDHAGYCQHFSGAMALLLRMGGVPARVASGFSPGTVDAQRREYVVRDVDAHSWVEVFVPGIGWDTRDPTPPVAPATSQSGDVSVGARDRGAAFGGSERALDRAPRDGGAGAPVAATGDDGGPSSGLLFGGVGSALALAGLIAGLVARRRRGGGPDADLAELRRALRRSGRPPPPPLTLAALAGRLAGTPAEAYVRAVAAARYGYGSARPTRAQRAALRRELGAGLGGRGWLRAWWALPPKLTRTPPRSAERILG
jgi:hypothetical protein